MLTPYKHFNRRYTQYLVQVHVTPKTKLNTLTSYIYQYYYSCYRSHINTMKSYFIIVILIVINSISSKVHLQKNFWGHIGIFDSLTTEQSVCIPGYMFSRHSLVYRFPFQVKFVYIE